MEAMNPVANNIKENKGRGSNKSTVNNINCLTDLQH